MASLYRYRVALTGFPGGPGVATHYFLDQQTALASLRQFWDEMCGILPLNVVVQCENAGDIVDSVNGNLTGSWAKPPVASSQGRAVGVYSAPTGAVISWLTSTVADNRRLRGRTFIVPCASSAFQTNGALTPAIIAAFQTAAQALIFEQSLSLVVWHRPIAARAATATSPAVAFRAGSHGLVTGSRVSTKAAVLRSRRD